MGWGRLAVGMEGRRARPDSAAADQTPAAYLDRHGVTRYLHDMLAVLLENRPSDPIDFISDYFDHVVQGDGGDPLQRCCRYIRLSKPGTRPFMDNLAAAYATLDLHQGLSAARLSELVRLLCRAMPFEVLSSVLFLVEAGGATSERVPFAEFVATIRVALMYEEFVRQAEVVFRACVAETSAGMSTRVFLALVKQAQALMDPAHSETAAEMLGKIPLPSSTPSVSAHGGGGTHSGPVTFDEFLAALLRCAPLLPLALCPATPHRRSSAERRRAGQGGGGQDGGCARRGHIARASGGRVCSKIATALHAF